MTRSNDRQGRAISMRRTGMSYAAICAELGVSMGTLSRWVRAAGLTTRNRVSAAQRAEAVRLRQLGKTYAEIQAATSVPKSTLSNLLKSLPLTAEHAASLAAKRQDAPSRSGATRRARRLSAEARTLAHARDEIGSLGDREILLCGVVLYWAEGAKSKPWSRGHRVTFMNSDPGLVRLFIRWVELLGIERDRLIVRVQIHQSADVERAQREWSRITGIPVESFRRPTLKRHNPRTRRRNVGEAYIGCLKIDVSRSTALYLRIAGMYEGIVNNAP